MSMIPVPLSSMSSFSSMSFLSEEAQEIMETINMTNVSGHVFSRQHKRDYQEDRYEILMSENERYPYYFAVYDGHGGSSVSEYLHKNMGRRVLDVISDIEPISDEQKKKISKLVTQTFLNIDKDMFDMKLDSGSTVTGCIVWESDILFFNLGDSRTVSYKFSPTKGRYEFDFKTFDHKPTHPEEEKRITNCKKGCVLQGGRVWRGNSGLAVSGAMGDFAHKNKKTGEQECVRNIPDLDWRMYSTKMAIVIASDGIWDVEKMYDSKDENVFIKNILSKINRNKDNPTVINKQYIMRRITPVRDNQTSIFVTITPPSEQSIQTEQTTAQYIPISSEIFSVNYPVVTPTGNTPPVPVPASLFSSDAWMNFSLDPSVESSDLSVESSDAWMNPSMESSVLGKRKRSSSSRRSKSSRSSRGRK